MYELGCSLSRIRSTSCRDALQENRTTEIGFCSLSECQHIVGLPGNFCSLRSRSERKKSGSTTAFTVVAVEKKYPSALRNILRPA